MIIISTPDNLTHGPIALLPSGGPDYASYSSSPNTQAALATAYDRGAWEPYAPPEPIALPPNPNPSAFRAALARTASWNAWAESISPVGYTNLTIAAAADNWTEAQAIYQYLALATPPPPAAIVEWQQLATLHAIPITF